MMPTSLTTPQTQAKLPEILQGKQLSNLLEEILIERSKNLEILHEYLNSFSSVMPERTTMVGLSNKDYILKLKNRIPKEKEQNLTCQVLPDTSAS